MYEMSLTDSRLLTPQNIAVTKNKQNKIAEQTQYSIFTITEFCN